MTCHARYRHRQTSPSVQRSLCAPRQGSACMRSARFVRDGAGQGWVFEKGSRAYLFRSNAPPTQRGPRDKAHNSFTGSPPATQTAEQGTGAVTKGPGWVSGAVGGSQVVLEQRASGRASPGMLCAGPRAARRLHHRIGSLEQDASRRTHFFGVHDLSRGRSCVSLLMCGEQ